MERSAKIALLSLAVTTTFGTMMAAPAVKLLAAAYPATNALLVQWVVTISSLFILPTLFLAGKLGRRFNRKSLLVTGLLAYIVGGIGPSFSHSFTMILAFRALLGLSIGLISATSNALVAENFQGPERSRMNGLQTSLNGIGGAIFLSLGGFIASFGWREVFLTYGYALVLLLLVAAYLPKFPPIQANRAAAASMKPPKFFYAVAVAAGLHSMLFTLIPTNLSLYLSDNGIGTVASTGYLNAVALIGVFAGGLAVTRLARALGKLLVPLDLALMAAGFLLIGSAHAVWTVALAVFLIGLAEGMLFPLSFIKTAEVVPTLGLTSAISMMLACVYACQFLIPLFVRGAELLLHADSARGMFIAIACALAATTAIYLPFARNRKRAAAQLSS